MKNTSPIQNLERRLGRLPKEKLLALSTFCAQAAVKNVDIYQSTIGWKKLLLGESLDEWFWGKLRRRVINFPFDYEEVEESLVALSNEMAVYPKLKKMSPAPASVMARESVFLFIANCSFFAGRGRLGQLLTVVNNCISCKIDYFYGDYLGMGMEDSLDGSLAEIYSFPIYMHAIADLDWVISLLETDEGEWASEKTLNLLLAYSKNCNTFVVDRPFFTNPA